jgi:hypothetical protein
MMTVVFLLAILNFPAKEAAPILIKNIASSALLLSTLGIHDVSHAFSPPLPPLQTPTQTSTSLKAYSVWTNTEIEWEEAINTLKKPIVTPAQWVNHLDSEFDQLIHSWMQPNQYIPEYAEGKDDAALLAIWKLRNEKYLILPVYIDGYEKTLFEFYTQELGGSRIEFGGWRHEVTDLKDVVKSFLFEVNVIEDLMQAASYRGNGRKDRLDDWSNLSDEKVSGVHYIVSLYKGYR